MAVSFVGAGTMLLDRYSPTNSTGFTLGKHASSAAGDLCLMILTCRDDNATWSTPAGWTELGQWNSSTSGISQQITVKYRVLDGTANDTPGAAVVSGGDQGSLNISDSCAGVIITLRGQVASWLGAISGSSPSEGTSQNIGAISALSLSEYNGALVVVGAKSQDWTSVDQLSGDTDFTWGEAVEGSTTLGSDVGLVVGYATWSGVAPTLTNKTFTVNGGSSDDWVGIMIEVAGPAPVTVSVGQATETESAQVVTPVKTIYVAVGQAAETETAGVVTPSIGGGPIEVVVGQATETETAGAVGHYALVNVGQSSETENSGVVTPLHSISVAQAVETETAQVVVPVKTIYIDVGQASETETTGAVTPSRVVAVRQATETETAGAVTPALAVAVGQAAETETAGAVGHYALVAVGQAVETETANAVGHYAQVSIGQALETESAHPVVPAKHTSVGQATEAETALLILPLIAVAVGIAIEYETAGTVQQRVVHTIGQATETESALATVAAVFKVNRVALSAGHDEASLTARSETISMTARWDSSSSQAGHDSVSLDAGSASFEGTADGS